MIQGKVFFAVDMLPEEFQATLVLAIRRVRDAVRYDYDDHDDFKGAASALKALVVGQRFSFEMVRRADGKRAIVRGTVAHLRGDPRRLGRIKA